MSYGTSAGVAVLVPRYANGSDFGVSTRPTKTSVETLLAQVSSLLDAMLGQFGFDVPVTDTEAVQILTLFVQEEVAAIIEGINGSGRFGPTTKQPAKSRFQIIGDDINVFLDMTSLGLEALGAARTAVPILFRASGQDGETVEPLFQRKAHGENPSKKW